ncbi:hypothetical protein LTS08_005024 [Lithohypha guttulata]|nr:hypothetical protein LTS08_005024 [Lithohypha guttulata]
MDSMDSFFHKSLITKPNNLTYSYYLSPNFTSQITSSPSLPILLFLHGFPDDAHMWADAMPHFQNLPYPMILPDLLGFSGSSKPTNPHLYNYRQQANSLAQILDAEGISSSQQRIIPIGHDWGSLTAQRFYLHHRQRCIGLCILSLAYQVPTDKPFSLWTANHETTKKFGYPQWSYWEFFVAPDAPDLMRENLERFWEVNNGNHPSPLPEENGRDIWMREMFCTKNAMREYVTGTGKWAGGKSVPLKPYPEGDRQKARFIARMSRDGFEGPVCYYHNLAINANLEDDAAFCRPGPGGEDLRKIDAPMLYVGQTGDWVCRTDLMGEAKEMGLVSDLEEKVVEAGHWCLYECPEKIAGAIGEWLVKRFPVQQ